MLFKSILVPWDGSKYSNHAFKIALDIAKKYDSKVTIVYCMESGEYRGNWYTDSRFHDAIIKKLMNAAKKEFSQLEFSAKKAGIQINCYALETNSIVKQLVSFAKSHKIDLIIMGAHGQTRWSKLVLGSISNGVTQHVHCPVLIVRRT